MINEVVGQVHLTVLKKHPVIISTFLECIIGIKILSNMWNSHIGLLFYVIRSIPVDKAKGKPLELPFPTKY